LAGVELDNLAAGLSCLFDSFKDCKPIEGIGLTADGKSAGLAGVRDFSFAAQQRRHRQGDDQAALAQEKNEFSLHTRLIKSH